MKFGCRSATDLYVWLVAIVLVLVRSAGTSFARSPWVTLEDCHYVANPTNDGDSFHVRVKDKEYIFRLYFVDAPETDAASPARLIEQAKYFGITVPQIIEIGEAAKTFVSHKLAELFTVRTHMANAMGGSRLERFYAIVQTKDGDLGGLLVENGLARVYGRSAKPPDLSTSNAEWQRLEQLESEAKRQKIGAWGVNLGRFSLPTDKPHKGTPNISVAPATPIPSNSSKAVAGVNLDINGATEKELKELPGIGPVLAQRIIAARPFRSADDLRKVNGIGDKKYAEIRPYFN